MHTILICDDDADIVNALKIYLSDPAYRLLTAYDGQTALELLAENEVDLLLLDIMMPKMDGLTVLARLRAESNIPVILLTAKSEDTDKILGLNLGADDYITKPFHPLEVTARVNSQLRRYKQLGGSRASEELLCIGGVELDDRSKLVTVDGNAVALTPKEYAILRLLMLSPGKVFAPKEIYSLVWNEAPLSGSENTVAVHIRHLREKLELDPADPRYVKVVFGQGYKFEKGRRP